MGLEIVILSERQIPSDIAYMWNLKKKKIQMNYLQNRNRLTDLQNDLWLPKGECWREG